MAKTSLWKIQTQVYSTLNVDATLGNLVQGVFDDVDENQAFPYVVVGDAVESRWDTLSRDGKDIAFTVHVWSRYRGNKETLDIVDRIIILLDGADLAVTGFQHVHTWHENTNLLRDPDGITRHGVIQFRALVQES